LFFWWKPFDKAVFLCKFLYFGHGWIRKQLLLFFFFFYYFVFVFHCILFFCVYLTFFNFHFLSFFFYIILSFVLSSSLFTFLFSHYFYCLQLIFFHYHLKHINIGSIFNPFSLNDVELCSYLLFISFYLGTVIHLLLVLFLYFVFYINLLSFFCLIFCYCFANDWNY
jgi:hypothetical protein